VKKLTSDQLAKMQEALAEAKARLECWLAAAVIGGESVEAARGLQLLIGELGARGVTEIFTRMKPDEVASFLEKVGTDGCFTAGTPLQTPDGTKSIEQFVPGDLVLSRDQHDPDGPVAAKVVEAVFTNYAQLIAVHAGGQVIETTAGHLFWVQGKGWLPARELIAGDRLVGHDRQWVVVEKVVAAGKWETVYNLRVADFHTYFVGARVGF
jgi:hypothetical protein